MKDIKRKPKMIQMVNIVFVVCLLLQSSFCTVYGASAEATWSSIITIICTWLLRIGGAVALFGGVNIGISFASDNPDSRVRGLQFLAAGLIVMAVAATPQIFGIA